MCFVDRAIAVVVRSAAVVTAAAELMFVAVASPPPFLPPPLFYLLIACALCATKRSPDFPYFSTAKARSSFHQCSLAALSRVYTAVTTPQNKCIWAATAHSIELNKLIKMLQFCPNLESRLPLLPLVVPLPPPSTSPESSSPDIEASKQVRKSIFKILCAFLKSLFSHVQTMLRNSSFFVSRLFPPAVTQNHHIFL